MVRNKAVFGVILCMTALALAACNGLGTPDPTPTATLPVVATPQATIAVPTAPVAPTAFTTPGKPTAAARPTALSGWNAKVTYQMGGGVTGRNWTLLVGPAGQARLIEGSKNSGPVRLMPEKLAILKQELDATDFFNLKDHYGAGNVSDDFIFTLSLTQDERTKTVVVEQVGGQGVTPQAVLDFIAELNKLQGEIEARPAPTGTP